MYFGLIFYECCTGDNSVEVKNEAYGNDSSVTEHQPPVENQRPDRMCVQCVTNSLQQKEVWSVTNKYILEDRSCIHVLSVGKVLLCSVTWGDIWTFTAVSTSALNVESVLEAIDTWQYTSEVILERSRLNALFVANDLHNHITLLFTAEFTVERNHANVLSVARHLVSLPFYALTWESTREKNHTSVHVWCKLQPVQPLAETQTSCTQQQKTLWLSLLWEDV